MKMKKSKKGVDRKSKGPGLPKLNAMFQNWVAHASEPRELSDIATALGYTSSFPTKPPPRIPLRIENDRILWFGFALVLEPAPYAILEKLARKTPDHTVTRANLKKTANIMNCSGKSFSTHLNSIRRSISNASRGLPTEHRRAASLLDNAALIVCPRGKDFVKLGLSPDQIELAIS